jgi:hypothetical protein
VQVSQGGAVWPAWSRDGKELFYSGGSPGHLTAVTVKPPNELAFDFAPPVRLFRLSQYFRSTSRGYDVAADGRFLFVLNPAATTSVERASIHLIVNWFDDLKARVK